MFNNVGLDIAWYTAVTIIIKGYKLDDWYPGKYWGKCSRPAAQSMSALYNWRSWEKKFGSWLISAEQLRRNAVYSEGCEGTTAELYTKQVS